MRGHIVHYLIITGIVALGISVTSLFSANRQIQLLSAIAAAFLYLCYGVLHHHLEHDLTIKIVVEYVLVALLAMALFIFVSGGN